MAIVSELVSKFSFVGSLTPQKEFNSNLRASITLLATAGAAIQLAGAGLFGFVTINTMAADALTDMNAETGIAVERIQELAYAAELSGSSQEAMTASLAGLSKVAGDASRGLGRGRKAFDDLGISVTDASGKVKTADVLFGELNESFRRLGTDSATQKSIIASLGLDPSTLQLLNASTQEIDALIGRARELGIVTGEQAEEAAKFQDSLGIAKFAVSALSQQVAVGLAPTMTDITNRFTDFLVANKDAIQNGIMVFSEAILVASSFISRMYPVLGILAGAFIYAKIAAFGFAKAMALVTSPVVLIAAGIIALLLIIDDLMVAFNGGQSVIRDFFLEFLGFDIVPIMQGIVDAFLWMIDTVSGLLEPWFAALGGLFSAVINVFKGNFTGALDDLKLSFAAFGDFVLGIVSGLLPDWVLQYLGAGESQPASLGPNDAISIGGGGVSNNSSTSNIDQQNQINVYSSDPKQAGAAVADSLQEQLRNAKTQANRGGR